jgi:hypothetical protein
VISGVDVAVFCVTVTLISAVDGNEIPELHFVFCNWYLEIDDDITTKYTTNIFNYIKLIST